MQPDNNFSLSHRDWGYLTDLIVEKTKAGLRAEASRGYLGVLWWVIEPLMYMCVFYVIAGHLFHRGDDNFIMFLLTGLITWKWFAAGINGGANSLMANGALMNQVYLPKIIFPLTATTVNTFKFFIILTLLLSFLLFASIEPSLVWMLLPVLLLTELLLIVSVGSLLAAVMPFFPDMRMILDNLLLALFFMSGIFFNIDQIPEPFRWYLMLNPMAQLIRMYRKLLLDGVPPNFALIFFINLFSLIILMLAVGLLRRFDRVYPKFVF